MTTTMTRLNDIGHGRRIQINGTTGQPVMGVQITHDGCAGTRCLINTPETRALRSPGTQARAMWEVVKRDPLSLAPQIVCECGEVGWLRNGKWVPADG